MKIQLICIAINCVCLVITVACSVYSRRQMKAAMRAQEELWDFLPAGNATTTIGGVTIPVTNARFDPNGTMEDEI